MNRLDEHALQQLRLLIAADAARSGADVDAEVDIATDLATDLALLVELAAVTPAWVEPHRAILDRWTEAGLLTSSAAAASALPAGPQVVGVDAAEIVFDRAEWLDGNLHLGLVPTVEDGDRAVYFRVVGAEPRMWDVHGVDNARIESTMSGLNVRVPMVRTDLALIRSSY